MDNDVLSENAINNNWDRLISFAFDDQKKSGGEQIIFRGRDKDKGSDRETDRRDGERERERESAIETMR